MGSVLFAPAVDSPRRAAKRPVFWFTVWENAAACWRNYFAAGRVCASTVATIPASLLSGRSMDRGEYYPAQHRTLNVGTTSSDGRHWTLCQRSATDSFLAGFASLHRLTQERQPGAKDPISHFPFSLCRRLMHEPHSRILFSLGKDAMCAFVCAHQASCLSHLYGFYATMI